MPSIECAICSDEFGKRNDSSDVIVTPCGHVFHEMCLSKWLQHGIEPAEPKTCPECRQSVTMSQTRRIYFNLSTVINNVQGYVEYLDSVIREKNNKLHVVSMQLDKLKYEWSTKLREKDYEIQRLNEKLKHREHEQEVHKLNLKVDKLKIKVRDLRLQNQQLRQNQSYPKMPMGAVQLNINGMNENMSSGCIPQFNSTESINPIRMPMPHSTSSNCDLSTPIYNQNLYGGQTSGTSTTIQNPFDCDPNTIRSISSIRNPLSTFTPTYQSQSGYMSAAPIQTFMNPINLTNPIQPTHATSTTQQQTISYNQTSFFLPISTSNSMNTTYFNANDQNSRANYDFTL